MKLLVGREAVLQRGFVAWRDHPRRMTARGITFEGPVTMGFCSGRALSHVYIVGPPGLHSVDGKSMARRESVTAVSRRDETTNVSPGQHSAKTQQRAEGAKVQAPRIQIHWTREARTAAVKFWT